MSENDVLKEYICKNGLKKLGSDPYDVYNTLIDAGVASKNSRFVLVTLMSGTHELARKGRDKSVIVAHIQLEHDIKKATAQKLADMYLNIFSSENKKALKKAENAGFKEFCKSVWTIEWDGICEWYAKHSCHYTCRANATLEISVEKEGLLKKHLNSELKLNPFLSADDIFDIICEQIEEDLDRDMEEYCNADDYYEPYLEEFVGEGTYDSEKKWVSWGLKIERFDGTGDVDFGP
ncbi:MAG: hypothetical protein IKI75_02530 [Lachnospiraceae bacterium]|nr:hypothetical protein [Lachnospiraceae bacterium]